MHMSEKLGCGEQEWDASYYTTKSSLLSYHRSRYFLPLASHILTFSFLTARIL